jgi:hypothetical protein
MQKCCNLRLSYWLSSTIPLYWVGKQEKTIWIRLQADKCWAMQSRGIEKPKTDRHEMSRAKQA